MTHEQEIIVRSREFISMNHFNNAFIEYIPGILAAFLIVIVTFIQISPDPEKIRKNTLLYGRDVITNGEIIFPHDDPKRDGSAHNVHDGNPNSALVIPYPGTPPEGSFVLLDAGLSHFSIPGESPQKIRIPVSISLYNGPCSSCDDENYRKIPRIKKMRVEFLKRQANDPDVDYFFPETIPIFSLTIDVPDEPGPLVIPLHIDPPAVSNRYPESTFYYRIKLTVLDIHQGTLFNDRVSMTEIEYTDMDLKTEMLKVWK